MISWNCKSKAFRHKNEWFRSSLTWRSFYSGKNNRKMADMICYDIFVFKFYISRITGCDMAVGFPSSCWLTVRGFGFIVKEKRQCRAFTLVRGAENWSLPQEVSKRYWKKSPLSYLYDCVYGGAWEGSSTIEFTTSIWENSQ